MGAAVPASERTDHSRQLSALRERPGGRRVLHRVEHRTEDDADEHWRTVQN